MDVNWSWLKGASKKGAEKNQDRAKNYNAKFRVEIDRLLKQGLSFQSIANHLNEALGPNRRGKPWIPQTVHRLYNQMSFDEADAICNPPAKPKRLRNLRF